MNILFGRRIALESGLAWWGCVAGVCILAGGGSLGQSRALQNAEQAMRHIELGNKKYKSGDFNGAIREYTETIKINPQNTIAYISRAISRTRTGDPEGAIADYNSAIRLDPASQIAYNNRGILKLHRGDNDGAIEDFTKSLGVYQRSFLSYFNRAKAKFNKGDYKGAIGDSTVAIKIKRRPVEPYYLRATAKVKLGDNEGAIVDFDSAISGRPNFAPYYNERGLARFNTGDYNGAIGDYNRAILVDPNFVRAYNNRGIAKHKKNRSEEAIEDFTGALRINPRHAPSYANRAAVRKDKGDYTGAIEDLTQAVRINPKDTLSYLLRGYLYYDTGRWLDALKDFSKTSQLESDLKGDDYYILRIWLINSRLGKRVQATAMLDEHLKNHPPGKATNWYRNLCSFLLGRLSEDALIRAADDSDLQKAKEQKCEAYFYAGSLHIIEGDLEGGLRLLRLCMATEMDAFTEYASARAEVESVLLGAHFQPAGEEVRNMIVLEKDVGFSVNSLIPGGPAKNAGLKVKDVLTKINDNPATAKRLQQLYETGKPNETAKITVMRLREKIQVNLKLGGKNNP